MPVKFIRGNIAEDFHAGFREEDEDFESSFNQSADGVGLTGACSAEK